MPAQPYDLISWIRLLLATATTAGYSLRQDDRSATILAEAYSGGCAPTLEALRRFNCGDESFWVSGAELERVHAKKLTRKNWTRIAA
jgi:hypothetical protein